MIRFHNGFIGMNNTCSRRVPTSPLCILLIHFSKQHEVQQIERERDQEMIRSKEGSTDEIKCQPDIKALEKKKEQTKGTTEAHLREI